MLNPWAIVAALVLAISLAGGGYYQGWEMRGDHEAAAAFLLKQQTDVALEVERSRADGLAAELAAEVRNIKTVTIEVIKEIPKISTVYIEAANETPKPIPDAVIVWGAVRLYNRALRPDLPAGSSEFAYPAGTTDITRAKIGIPDILGVHVENAGRYAECRAQLNKLIDFEIGRQ